MYQGRRVWEGERGRGQFQSSLILVNLEAKPFTTSTSITMPPCSLSDFQNFCRFFVLQCFTIKSAFWLKWLKLDVKNTRFSVRFENLRGIWVKSPTICFMLTALKPNKLQKNCYYSVFSFLHIVKSRVIYYKNRI